MAVSIVTYDVLKENDGSGYYAGCFDSRRGLVWRSLTTRDEEKAERWRNQARCHGVDAHHLDCPDCKVGG